MLLNMSTSTTRGLSEGDAAPLKSAMKQRPQTVTRRLGALWHSLFVRRTLSPTDTADGLVRKQALVVVLITCAMFAVVGVCLHNLTGGARWRHTVTNYGVLSFIFTGPAIYAKMCITKRAGAGTLAAFSVAAFAIILSMDVHRASSFDVRAWPLFVILLDILLICDAPEQLTLMVMLLVVLWIVFTQLEYLLRFGLFDLPGLEPYDDRRAITDCVYPPCARGDGFAEGTLLAIFVFVMDFTLTRGFKRQVRAQQLALHDSMAVAREVAYALAEYDLDAAERYLDTHGGRLPEGWQPIYGELLTNLRAYKPFLPNALFRSASDKDCVVDENDVDPVVGGCSETVTVLSSTLRSDTHADTDGDGSSQAGATPPQAPLVPGKQLTPTGQRVQVQARQRRDTFSRIRVDDKKVSLLSVVLDIDQNAAGDLYAREHSTILAVAIDAVKTHRGSVDYFHGEMVHASFNAFRAAATHAVCAIAAAVDIAEVNGGAAFASCTVVSGVARVGTLGTSMLLSPSVVGALPQALVAFQDAGSVLDESIVCNRTCFVDACVQYPMRVLLHKVALGRGPASSRRTGIVDTADDGPESPPTYEVLYCVERHLASSLSARRNSDCQEWMYEVAEGDVWAVYNEAARLCHADGPTAAMQHFKGPSVDLRRARQFARDVEDAMFIDMRTRRVPLGYRADMSIVEDDASV